MKLTQKEILKAYPDLRVGKSNNSSSTKEKESAKKKRQELCDFARDHGFVIHPGRGYNYYIESFLMFDCCPCDPNRKSCPCNEAINEVTKIGHCICRLFWRDLDTYKSIMIKGGE